MLGRRGFAISGSTPCCKAVAMPLMFLLIHVIQLLIDGCFSNSTGNTALIHSAYIGNDVALELLVKNFRRLGLNIDHYNKAGYTALHIAATKGFVQCAKVLTLKGKASVTLKDKVHRLTPLEWCLRMGFQKSEVEFLKPAAKFYKVAKLTTTMVKCRKKSDQDLPVSQTSPRRSPTRTTEKPKFKVRSLLNKAKTHGAEDSGQNTTGTACKYSSQSTKVKTNEKNVVSKFIAKSTSNFLSKSKYKHILGKGRQRSLSQSDQPEEVQAAAHATTGLTHSRSHPVTTVCLQAITSECSSEGETSQENMQEYIILPDEFGDCDTDDLDSCNLDINSDYLSTQNKAIYYGHATVYCGEIESCSSAASIMSPVIYEEGIYSGTSSSNSNDSPAGYYKQGRDTPANSKGFYASGESSFSEQSIRSCTESTPSSSNSFRGGDEGDSVSDNSRDESSNSSSDETHTTVIDKNPQYSHENLSSTKQSNHASKSKQNITTHLKHKTGISGAIKRSVSETGFDTVSQLTEIEYLDDTCNPALPQEDSRQMKNRLSSHHTNYVANSKELNNSSSLQSVFTQRKFESPNTDRNLLSPQTEIEYIDHEDLSQSPDIPRCSKGDNQNSEPQSNSNTKGNTKSTKRGNDNTKFGNYKTDNAAKHFETKSVLTREFVNKDIETTRDELTSPETDITSIDQCTPDSITDDRRFEYLKNINVHDRTDLKTKVDHNSTHSAGEYVNEMRHVRATRQDMVSPQTEIEYIDIRTPDAVTDSNILDILDNQRRHDLSEDKSEATQTVILSKKPLTEIKHIRTTQISPDTEIDYVDPCTSNLLAQSFEEEWLKETDTYVNVDESIEDGNDIAHAHFTVKKSLHDFKENVMQLVDLATSQGFVVESKHIRKREVDQEEVNLSSCEGSRASSGVETLIVNLENDLSYLSVDSLLHSINGETVDVEKEDNETC